MKYTGYFVYAVPVEVDAEDEEDALYELDDIPTPDFLNGTAAEYQGTLLRERTDEALILEPNGEKLISWYQ